MKETIYVGLIGLGLRGKWMLQYTAEMKNGIEISIISDLSEEKLRENADAVEQLTGKRPITTVNYKDVIQADIDAVIIMTGWEEHFEMAIEAMYAGKYAAIEVGGAYSIDQCWRLVRAYEETGKPCMMLENDCYNETLLAIQNMERQGLLGEIVHCTGGYHHDIRFQVVGDGVRLGHYRMKNYMTRNCDNYPTHELGPLAKLLRINRGNRMLTLTSTASKQRGISQYIKDHGDEFACLKDTVFAQGDVVTTVIKCANGETMVLTLDTTLPRYHIAGITVHGTKGLYSEHNESVFLEDVHSDKDYDKNWKKCWGNVAEYTEKYGHPVWKKYGEVARATGHGGIDYMVLAAFYESVKKECEPPIDTYDTAAWTCISVLSEQSVATGGTPVAVPDFTNGKWATNQHQDADLEFSLD